MRTPSLVLLAAALLSCGQQDSACLESRPLDQEERALFSEAASLAQFPEASPDSTSVAFQEVDSSCPGGWDVRHPGDGRCLGAYFALGCRAIVVPAGAREAWPEWWEFLILHESLHAVLRQETGDADREHEHEAFSRIRPPWEES